MKNLIAILIATSAIAFFGCDKKGDSEGTKDRVRAEQDAIFERERDRAKIQQDEALAREKERAQKEQEAARESEAKTQAEKAEKMELELTRWHHYYAAIEGRYIADFEDGGEKYKLELMFTRSIPPFSGGRVRQLSEIETDKNNLSFQMTASQWNINDKKSNVPCEGNQVKFQSMDSGGLLAKAVCRYSTNTYSLLFSEEGVKRGQHADKAKELAEKINKNALHSIDVIVGEVRYASDPTNAIPFIARKVK